MDFITGLSRIMRQHDSIMVVLDGQTERVNKILEDMLRMYVMHQQRKWEEYLLLV